MAYEQVKHLNPGEFKRLCGVGKETFEQIVSVLRTAEQQKKSGQPAQIEFRRPSVNDIGVFTRISGCVAKIWEGKRTPWKRG